MGYQEKGGGDEGGREHLLQGWGREISWRKSEGETSKMNRGLACEGVGEGGERTHVTGPGGEHECAGAGSKTTSWRVDCEQV